MKFLFCRWGSICEPGMINAFKNLGLNCIEYTRSHEPSDYDSDYLNELTNILLTNPDVIFVISINFIPIISRATKPFNKLYISYVVDCPCSTMFSNTLQYSHNIVFCFDKLQAQHFSNINIGHIIHLPLCCDIDNLNPSITQKDMDTYNCDISFIGSLYSEISSYNKIQHKLPEYIKGYVDGLIHAQSNVYGYNFIEESLSEHFIEDFMRSVDFCPLPPDYQPNYKSIIADTYIGTKCTEYERITTLNFLGEYFNVDLYTTSDVTPLKNIQHRGPADSITMMPKIFKCSKINLNITSRSIKSGIPQRVYDILGAGGFLITNYQSELLDLFVPDEEIVIYESLPDLYNKVDYYLNHEEERQAIANRSYEKVCKYYTYDNQIDKMLNIISKKL